MSKRTKQNKRIAQQKIMRLFYIITKMNSKAEFFRLAGSTVVIEYKNKSIITAIRIIEFGEKTTKFILLNGDEVTIDNNQKLTRNSNGYIVIKA